MQDIYVNRKIFTYKSTIGKLSFDGLELFTLEDTMRKRDLNQDDVLQENEKVYGSTAIPAGVYDVFIKDSTRYKRPMPYLKNVPYFSNIMIHWGNFPEDTLGCILVGLGHSMIDKIDESKKAFDKLFPMIEEALKERSLRIHLVGGYRSRVNDE